MKKFLLLIVLVLIFGDLYNISGWDYSESKQRGWTVGPKIVVYEHPEPLLPAPCPAAIGPGFSEPELKGYPFTIVSIGGPCVGGQSFVYPIGIILNVCILLGVYYLIKKLFKF